MTIQSLYRILRPISLLISLVVGGVIVGGCGSTQQTNLWADPSYNAAPLTKILVIAIRKDQIERRIWEDAIATDLNSRENAGTIAVASYQLFPDNVPDTLAVRLKTEEERFDGVLVVGRAEFGTLTADVPGYTAIESVTTFSRRWNAYVTRYQDVYHPGYTESETTLSVRTDLLLPGQEGKLVWSVTSESVDPTSAKQFRSSVADRVVSQLRKSRFIH